MYHMSRILISNKGLELKNYPNSFHLKMLLSQTNTLLCISPSWNKIRTRKNVSKQNTKK